MNPLLVTMRGPGEIDIPSLSNFEAGIAFLTLINRMSPGITFGQLAALIDTPERMGGWWTDLKRSVGDVKDGIGDVLKDTASAIGGGAGDAVRLVTDEKVLDAASRAATAYATGGGSEGVRNALGGTSGGGGMVDQFIGFISSLGSSFKGVASNQASVGGVSSNVLPWALAGGAVLVVLFARPGARR